MDSNGTQRGSFGRWWFGLGLAAVFSAACGGSKPPAPTPPPKKSEPPPTEDVLDEPLPPEPIDTGIDCAKAQAQCEPGFCKAVIDNRCDAPVNCHFSMLSICQGGGTSGESRGGNRGTVGAKSKGEIQATADCSGRRVELSQADALTCR